MIVLLDTNVALDYILHRSDYENANSLLQLAMDDKELECVTATTVTDICYNTHHYKEEEHGQNKYNQYEAQDMLSDFLKYVEILEVNNNTVLKALQLRWKDFEDALQYTVAIENAVDCIVTNNIKDFKNAEIEVLTPKQFLEKYYAKTGGDRGEGNSHINYSDDIADDFEER